MTEIEIHEILDVDPRPAFIVDLHTQVPGQPLLHLPFCNKQLRTQPALLKSLLSGEGSKYQQWLRSTSSAGSTHVLGNIQWFAYTVRGRWRVVQAQQQYEDEQALSIFNGLAHKDNGLSRSPPSAAVSKHGQITPDLTVYDFGAQNSPFVAGMTPAGDGAFVEMEAHLSLVRNVDWASTCMGPLQFWPASLLHVIHLMLLTPKPRAMIIGQDHLMLYNQPYATLCGQRHPGMLGQPVLEAWPEAAAKIRSDFATMQETHRAVNDEIRIFINRSGFLEEIYFLWATVPLAAPLLGFYISPEEITQARLAARRETTLVALGEACTGLRTLKELWRAMIHIFESNSEDFPLGFLYSRASPSATDSPVVQLGRAGCRRIGRLEGMLGADVSDGLLPTAFNADKGSEPFLPVFRQLLLHGTSQMIKPGDNALPRAVVEHSRTRGFGDACDSAIVILVRSNATPQDSGILTLGLNTRRPYDHEYQLFMSRLSRTLGDLASSTFRAQEEDRIEREATKRSASEHDMLTEALAVSTMEAKDYYGRLQSMAKVIEMSEVAIFEFSPDGRLLQANEAFYTLTGHPREMDAVAFAWLERVYDDDRALALGQWSRLCQGIAITPFELRWQPQDFEQLDDDDDDDAKWGLSCMVPICDDDDGTVRTISGCITDISQQKRRQEETIQRAEALEAAKLIERRFKSFTEMAPAGIIFFTAEMQVTYCNRAWFGMMGHPRVPYRTVSWESIVLEEDRDHLISAWAEMLSLKMPIEATFRTLRTWTNGDGATDNSWCLVTAYPELDKDGNVEAVVCINTDISHLKWAETVQKQRVDEAMEAKRQQENFIDMTSHEIRNPLGAVVHCADSISASLAELKTLANTQLVHLPDATRNEMLEILDSSVDAVNTIISCSVHQKRIVDDILTLSKLDSNLLQINPWLTKPDTVLHEIESMFAVDAARVGVDLRVVKEDSVAQSRADWVMLDPGRTLQVLINLLTNALKFTAKGDRRRVTVRMGASLMPPLLHVDLVPVSTTRISEQSQQQSGDETSVYLYWTVQDTGCGMTPEEKAKIFSRFEQGSLRTHTKYGGSGLGLFISRELTEMQGGRIGVASEPGVGSTFAFYIKTSLAAPPADDQHLSVSAMPAAQLRKRSLRNTHAILVVEDNLVNQRVIATQLRKLGHEVHVAAHGGEALDVLARSRHWAGREHDGLDLDICLMDVEMPVMDGLTCAARIRELQREGKIVGHVPIIAVSANARVEQVNLAIAAGMDDAIAKPFRVADLIPKMDRLLVRQI